MKVVSDIRQDGNVPIGKIGNLARRGPSAVSEMQSMTTQQTLS